MAETERLPTGVSGLDRVLRGGLLRGGLHLIAGPPGAGKTILAHQIAAAHANAAENVVYLTALVEGHDTLIAQASEFSFFDDSIVGRTLYYTGLYPALESGGLTAAQEEATRIARERRPVVLALDGLHVVKATASSEFEFSRFMNELQTVSSVTGTTILALINAARARVPAPEFAMSDGVIWLERRMRADGLVRTLEVQKMRGAEHVTGHSTFRIDANGISVFPRLEGIAAFEGIAARTPSSQRLSLGVPGLDEMIGGGIVSGSVTMLAGAPGAGKTATALSFLVAGADADERGLLLGFHETPDRLVAKAASIDIALGDAVEREQVRIDWRRSAELLADELADDLLRTVDRHRIRRVVIDGLGDLRRALPTPERATSFLNVLADLLRGRGIGVILTQELEAILDLRVRIPLEAVASVADNIILLRYIERQAHLHRLVSIVKMRDQEYDSAIREFEITRRGISVGGMLHGSGPESRELGRVTERDDGGG